MNFLYRKTKKRSHKLDDSSLQREGKRIRKINSNNQTAGYAPAV